MEHVAGSSLKEMIQRLRRLSPMLAADFVCQVAAALEYAHNQGVVHRDVNPSNIIVQPGDRIKILDFGLACPAGTEDFGNTGTAHYMAPEQIDADPVDGRTDIYALAVTAHEMVTGKLPFPETDLSKLLELHTTLDIPDPELITPGIPEQLREFIVTAGRRDPARRYASAADAIRVLEPLVSDRRKAMRMNGHDGEKTSTLIMAYADHQQKALDQLIATFCSQAQAIGITVDRSRFSDFNSRLLEGEAKR
jgi:serine/threonine protein kinase